MKGVLNTAGSVDIMASNTEMTCGYDHEFVEQVSEDYICSICHLAMRKPVQTKCGHQFCKDCLDAALQRKRECPLDNCSLTSQQVFQDLATERRILSLKIKCPNHCDWNGELRDIKTHDEKCLLATGTCCYANWGCKFKGTRKSLIEHYKDKLLEHLELTSNQLSKCQDENSKQVAELKTELRRLQEESKKQVAEFKTKLTALKDENKNLEKEVTELKSSNVTLMNKDDQSCYSYTWKIKDFSKQLELAKKEGRDIRLTSESFYTHKYGYKLKLRLYPNGQGNGKGTHVSVYMAIMRGEYDAILNWPFTPKWKFIVHDQKPNHSMRKNIKQSDSDPNDKSHDAYQKPTANENAGIGKTTFVSHDKLKTENYIVDGAVFITFVLENPQI